MEQPDISPDTIKQVVDELLSDNPCGMCMGKLAVKLFDLERARAGGLCPELLTAAIIQHGALN